MYQAMKILKNLRKKNNIENKTWTQRAKELINNAWSSFKYYANPINWFTSWWG